MEALRLVNESANCFLPSIQDTRILFLETISRSLVTSTLNLLSLINLGDHSLIQGSLVSITVDYWQWRQTKNLLKQGRNKETRICSLTKDQSFWSQWTLGHSMQFFLLPTNWSNFPIITPEEKSCRPPEKIYLLNWHKLHQHNPPLVTYVDYQE